MSPAFERFDLRSIPPKPWKNGAGLTREIAVEPAGRPDFDWRFSLAEVTHDAPFSAFPGIDRCIVLLEGAGMRLLSSDGRVDHRLDRTLQPFHFSGELPLAASLIDGPCSDFNVMTRRGAWSCETSVHTRAGTLQGAGVTLLLSCAGDWRVDVPAPEPLRPLQGLLWRQPMSQAAVRPARTDRPGALLLVRLCHDRTS